VQGEVCKAAVIDFGAKVNSVERIFSRLVKVTFDFATYLHLYYFKSH